MKYPISVLKEKFKGQDIYVCGAGKSLNLDKEFWKDKIVLGVNDVFKFIPVTYVVMKDVAPDDNVPASKDWVDWSYKFDIIVSYGLYGGLCNRKNADYVPDDRDCFIFQHRDNLHHDDIPLDIFFDKSECYPLNPIYNEDEIIVSYSTISSAIHIAAYMGAKNIFVYGHNGQKEYVEGYPGSLPEEDFFSRIYEFTLRLIPILERRYGCRISII